jgi:hypothetical protein
MTYDNEFDSEFVFDDETSVEFRLRQKKAAEAIRRLDRHYEKYTLPFKKTWKDGKYYNNITIENYGSRGIGTKIRNAVTGTKYNIDVGSSDEDILFKVTDATGRFGRKESLRLYYDSPEQYENHHFTSVSLEMKQQWYERALKAQKRMEQK